MHYSATPNFMVQASSGSFKMASMHYHSSYELYYLEVGSREYFVEDRLFHVCAGDFVLIPPQMLHRTGGEYGARTLVSFTEHFLESVFSRDAIDRMLQCFKHTKITPSGLQRETCRNLLKQMLASQDDSESAMLLGLLLTELGKCESQPVGDDAASAIAGYINANFSSIENISQIAEHFYISKFHLCRLFKKAMQITVIDYLNQVRIRNACQMLDYSDMSVSEISDSCGYHSVSYFSNVFKKITGRSPSEYRGEAQE